MVTAVLFYVEVFIILLFLVTAFTICCSRLGNISFRKR